MRQTGRCVFSLKQKMRDARRSVGAIIRPIPHFGDAAKLSPPRYNAPPVATMLPSLHQTAEYTGAVCSRSVARHFPERLSQSCTGGGMRVGTKLWERDECRVRPHNHAANECATAHLNRELVSMRRTVAWDGRTPANEP